MNIFGQGSRSKYKIIQILHNNDQMAVFSNYAPDVEFAEVQFPLWALVLNEDDINNKYQEVVGIEFEEGFSQFIDESSNFVGYKYITESLDSFIERKGLKIANTIK